MKDLQIGNRVEMKRQYQRLKVGEQGTVWARFIPAGRKTPSTVDLRLDFGGLFRRVPTARLKLVKEDK